MNKKIILLLIFLFTANDALALVITLKSGKILKGEVIEQTDEYIKLHTGEDRLYQIPLKMMDETTIEMLEERQRQLDEQKEPAEEEKGEEQQAD